VRDKQQRDAQREAARRRLLNRRCSRLAAAGVNARRSLHYDAIKRVLNAVSEQIERMKTSGRKRGERDSAVSEQETECECERHSGVYSGTGGGWIG